MILCAKCRFWQHGVCYKILDDEDAPERHICALCADVSYVESQILIWWNVCICFESFIEDCFMFFSEKDVQLGNYILRQASGVSFLDSVVVWFY